MEWFNFYMRKSSLSENGLRGQQSSERERNREREGERATHQLNNQRKIYKIYVHFVFRRCCFLMYFHILYSNVILNQNHFDLNMLLLPLLLLLLTRMRREHFSESRTSRNSLNCCTHFGYVLAFHICHFP